MSRGQTFVVFAILLMPVLHRRPGIMIFGFYGFPACLRENVGINKLGLDRPFSHYSKLFSH